MYICIYVHGLAALPKNVLRCFEVFCQIEAGLSRHRQKSTVNSSWVERSAGSSPMPLQAAMVALLKGSWDIVSRL